VRVRDSIEKVSLYQMNRMRQLNLTDESLVLLMKNSESKAFEVIYQRYWRQLYGFANQQLGVPEDAEEVVHDVMMSLWENREHSNIQNLRVYMFIAVRNLVNKRIKVQINLRKYFEFKLLQEVSENSNVTEILTNEELTKAVDLAMQQMPERTATVFRMSKLDEVPVKKIALELGITDKAVEYHITRSIKMLRQHLSDFHHDN
jgi:RNA polymerase sigma-70 factor (family 1)